MIKNWEKGAVYMAVSSLFLSLLALCVKVGIRELSVLQITFFRYFAPLILSLPYFLRKNFYAELRLSASVSTHILRSVAAVSGQLCLNYYFTEASVLNGVMLWCTGPLFVPILARIFYGQRMVVATWISLLVSFIGVAMIIKPTAGLFDPFSIWGLLAGLSAAFSQILWGKNAETGKVSENLFYLYVFSSALSLIPLLIFKSEQWHAIPMDSIVWFTLIGLGVASIGNQLFRSKAYKVSTPALLSPILYASVIGSGFIDWLVFNNIPDLWTIVGFMIVVIGALIKWRILKRV